VSSLRNTKAASTPQTFLNLDNPHLPSFGFRKQLNTDSPQGISSSASREYQSQVSSFQHSLECPDLLGCDARIPAKAFKCTTEIFDVGKTVPSFARPIVEARLFAALRVGASRLRDAVNAPMSNLANAD
jgi:hypothetical protein